MNITDVLSVEMFGGLSFATHKGTLSNTDSRSQKLYQVFSYLILNRARSISQSELIDIFWQNEACSNPSSAIKTLMHRMRTLLAPLFSDGVIPIISQRGGYSLNPCILCELDIEHFEQLALEALSRNLPDSTRLSLCMEALALYHGDLLPTYDSLMWVSIKNTYLQNLYLDCAQSYAKLLRVHKRYSDVENVCLSALSRISVNEDLYILLIEAMLRQGRVRDALASYNHATELLYSNLHVAPSQELRALYDELTKVNANADTTLQSIEQDLRKAACPRGSFLCSYTFFRETYRLQAQRAQRNGVCIQLALLSLTFPPAQDPQPQCVREESMARLEEILAGSLRSDDMVARFNDLQFVVLLPNTTVKESNLIMERLATNFRLKYKRMKTPPLLACSICQMTPDLQSIHNTEVAL